MISTCQQLILIFLFFFESSAVAVPTGDFGQLFGVRVIQQLPDPVREYEQLYVLCKPVAVAQPDPPPDPELVPKETQAGSQTVARRKPDTNPIPARLATQLRTIGRFQPRSQPDNL